MHYSGIRRSAATVAVLTFLALLLPATEAMICYRCTVLPPQYVGDADQPCSKFDGSSRFYQDCPTSTFCVKRITHYPLPNRTMITTAERGCASQKFVFQDYNENERRWNRKEKVDTEAYQNGCFKGENKGTPNGPSEYCYCSSNYCNKSSPLANPLQNCSFLVMMMLLYLGVS